MPVAFSLPHHPQTYSYMNRNYIFLKIKKDHIALIIIQVFLFCKHLSTSPVSVDRELSV